MSLLLFVSSVQATDTNDTADIISENDDVPISSAEVAVDGQSLASQEDSPVLALNDENQGVSSENDNPISTQGTDDAKNIIGSTNNEKVEKVISASDNVVSASSSKPKTKTFSDLADKINHAKSKSTLVLYGKYKYNPKTDGNYKWGIDISKHLKIIGKKSCVIDGSGKACLFRISDYYKVTFKEITFKNGLSYWSNGGAIFANSKSKVVINKCVFKNNKAYQANGGAIATFDKVTLKIYNSKFYYNKAIRHSSQPWPKEQRGMGGAIHVYAGSKLVLQNSVFKKNSAYLTIILVMSNANGQIKTSNAIVKNCQFERNTANINGVFYLDEYGKGTFINCKFKNNVAKKDGGTLILDASKRAVVKNCRFEGNTGYVGAAIDLFKFNNMISHASIVGCTFVKNKAKESGGAIYSDLGSLKITSSKFISNKATTSGGAIWTSGALKLKKVTFKKNSAKNGGAILLKNRNSIYANGVKYSGNKAWENGPNLLGLKGVSISSVKILH